MDRLSSTRKWARIAHQLDQELGPVTFDGVAMLDGETVSAWRARNQSAIKAHLAAQRDGWDWAQYKEYWA